MRIPTTEAGTEIRFPGGIITFSPEIELTKAQAEAFRTAFNQIMGVRVEGAAPGPAVQIISNADIYPGILADEQRHAELLAWLRANGIDPHRVPDTSELTVEQDGGGHAIRHTVMFHNEEGRPYLADPAHPGKGPATVERTTPLTVPLPDSWPQPVQRAESTKES